MVVRARSSVVIAWLIVTAGLAGPVAPTGAATAPSATPRPKFQVISAGHEHSCGLLANATVACWGDNRNGEIGDGTTKQAQRPRLVPGLAHVLAISTGNLNSCAVLANRTARCWGVNGFASSRLKPTPVKGLSHVVAIALEAYHSCAVLEDGTAKCWGDNRSGELGNGPYAASADPVPVNSLTGAVAVTVGADFSCALLADRTARCWGRNTDGELGNGIAKNVKTSTPTRVKGLVDAVALTTDWSHSCALLANGTIQCWGNNYAGQLGNGTYQSSATPVAVHGITNAVGVAAGGAHVCALLDDGTVKCWGSNADGMLGNSNVSEASGARTPVRVLGLGHAVAIAAGGEHTCALLADGTTRCWGANAFGQLGNGSHVVSSTAPVLVGGP